MDGTLFESLPQVAVACCMACFMLFLAYLFKFEAGSEIIELVALLHAGEVLGAPWQHSSAVGAICPINWNETMGVMC